MNQIRGMEGFLQKFIESFVSMHSERIKKGVNEITRNV